jgi:hypothetical protein
MKRSAFGGEHVEGVVVPVSALVIFRPGRNRMRVDVGRLTLMLGMPPLEHEVTEDPCLLADLALSG